MITVLIIIICILLGLSIFLIHRGMVLVSQSNELRNILTEYIDREETTEKALQSMLARMKELDMNGSFESDDEVGYVFTQLKNIIEEYSKV
jgi:predicted PurR-regulated permease PerM